jgi:carbon monoxide dehydrogenase subunit G
MEVKLEKRYPVDVEPARAWAMLRDVRAVAGCMPGAAITEQVDDTHYKGTVKVKVGPANAAFGGDIEVLGLDEAAMRLQLLGKGADRAGSSASMNLTAHVEPGDIAATSVLVGDAVVIVNGKFAQFGGRMMVQVSDMLLAQFADNFRAAAAALPATGAAVAEAAAPQAAADAAAPGAAAATAAPGPAPGAAAPPKANEINALAIAWGLFKHWLAGLFGRRT